MADFYASVIFSGLLHSRFIEREIYRDGDEGEERTDEQSALETELLTRHTELGSEGKHTRVGCDKVGYDADELRADGCTEVAARRHKSEHNDAACGYALGDGDDASRPEHRGGETRHSARDKADNGATRKRGGEIADEGGDNTY